MKSRLKTVLIWTFLIVLFVVLLLASAARDRSVDVSFETFLESVNHNDVESYSFGRSGLQFRRRSVSGNFNVRVGSLRNLWTKELAEKLQESGATYEASESKPPSTLATILISIVAVAVVFFVLIFLLAKFGAGQNKNIFSLRTSNARLVEESSKVKFDDIGGCVEAKQELSDLVDFLKTPQRWIDAGARLPRGVLLEGPPGCGKTLLAKAVAGETDAKFYHTSGSEFVEMFVGVGSARVRDMFETAKKNLPAVLFIDELDAIGRRRGSGVGFSNEEREQTLNQILVCMDGFETSDRIVVIAATNRSDILDKALVRAGRFDRRIKVPLLGHAEREAVLGIHTRSKPLSADVSLPEIADWTDGFTGADLEGLTNSAALMAVRRTRNDKAAPTIQQEDFRLAIQKQQEQQRSFDALDAVLFEATTQLAEPTARAVVRITLHNETTVEGEVVWVDPVFVKIRRPTDGSTCIVPKTQIVQLEALAGTAVIALENLQVDRSLSRGPNFA